MIGPIGGAVSQLSLRMIKSSTVALFPGPLTVTMQIVRHFD